jgi:fucokinase
MNSESDIPIAYLIVTAPNASVCSIYEKQLKYLCRQVHFLKHCKPLCVADPDGIRVGSGGGTLNAISELVKLVGHASVMSSRIVVIHSGGDSRRAPLNSVCGKAWSGINSQLYEDNILGASPLLLLLNELRPILEAAGVGTVLVASSDVLVNLCPSEVCYLMNLHNTPVLPTANTSF